MRSKKHLDSVRPVPCSVCGKVTEANDPHHPRQAKYGSGAGLKAGDEYVISLCHDHHDEYHREPVDFHKKYGSHELLLEKTTALRTAETWWLK